MSKANEPTWLLNEEWGASTDSFNWIHLHRSSGSKFWTAKGYYRDPAQLFLGLIRKLCRTEPADPDLVRHIEAISERARAAAARLSADLNRMAWSGLHRPSAHPKRSSKK